jgi:hypothetical protein
VRLADLDRKVAFLIAQCSVPYVDTRPPPNAIEKLVIAGDRLAAVRMYQQQHKAYLFEAKRAIDEIAARYGL